MQHANAVFDVAFSPDGRTALTGCWDGTARLWDVPRPLKGDPERVLLWVEVITGVRVDEMAVPRLDAAAWEQRRLRLHELGGPLDSLYR